MRNKDANKSRQTKLNSKQVCKAPGKLFCVEFDFDLSALFASKTCLRCGFACCKCGDGCDGGAARWRVESRTANRFARRSRGAFIGSKFASRAPKATINAELSLSFALSDWQNWRKQSGTATETSFACRMNFNSLWLAFVARTKHKTNSNQ